MMRPASLNGKESESRGRSFDLPPQEALEFYSRSIGVLQHSGTLLSAKPFIYDLTQLPVRKAYSPASS